MALVRRAWRRFAAIGVLLLLVHPHVVRKRSYMQHKRGILRLAVFYPRPKKKKFLRIVEMVKTAGSEGGTGKNRYNQRTRASRQATPVLLPQVEASRDLSRERHPISPRPSGVVLVPTPAGFSLS